MKTIVIIDDDIHVGNMAEEVLCGFGYEVIRAYPRTEAVAAVKKSLPCALFASFRERKGI